MGTLFHAVEDLLTFGTVVIVAMLAGGLLVILAIIADSVWLVRETHRAHQDEGQLYLLESMSQQGQRTAQLKKTA